MLNGSYTFPPYFGSRQVLLLKVEMLSHIRSAHTFGASAPQTPLPTLQQHISQDGCQFHLLLLPQLGSESEISHTPSFFEKYMIQLIHN